MLCGSWADKRMGLDERNKDSTTQHVRHIGCSRFKEHARKPLVCTQLDRQQGNLWLFGGNGSDAVGNYGFLNDLWEYSPATNQWAWMGRNSTLNGSMGSGIYIGAGVSGTLGTPAVGNIPEGRADAVSWTDAKGNLWLFGGYNYGSGNSYFNDLWEFNPSTNQWAWMSGSKADSCLNCYQHGIYGTLGTAAAGNVPGSRMDAVSWTDSKGNLWLFGGDGVDSNGVLGALNDLWEFNPSTNQWAWIGGSNTIPECGTADCGQSGVYGTLGTSAAGNIPGARYSASGWSDSKGHFWLWGGSGFNSTVNDGSLNDLWEFNPSTNQWTWMSGISTYPANCSSSVAGSCGLYGGMSSAGNIPGARQGAASWIDSKGYLWLFGGLGFDATGRWGYLDDLWVYSPSTNEWAWMSGSSTVSCTYMYCGQPGVYGTLQTPALGNNPSSREHAVSWTDAGGNLWLFGGIGINVVGTCNSFQDLWEFQPNTSGSLPLTATPTFSPDSGATYTTVQTVTINDTTPGATIYYLINGNTPASEYTAPIPVSSSETIEAIAGASGYANSAVTTATYAVQVSPATTPTFSTATGTYATPQTVVISDTTPGATIYYTTDQTMPTTSSAIYSGPISISSSETILAIAVANGFTNSAIASAVYTIGSNSSLGEWVWMGGFSVENIPGVYGTLRTPATGNKPGARSASTGWTDQSGNLWLFGGNGVDANGNQANLNDLWEFSPSTHLWAWMGGSSTVSCTSLLGVTNCANQPGVYGTLGTPAAANISGGRSGSAGWTDSGGHRWLFGGSGADANGP